MSALFNSPLKHKNAFLIEHREFRPYHNYWLVDQTLFTLQGQFSALANIDCVEYSLWVSKLYYNNWANDGIRSYYLWSADNLIHSVKHAHRALVFFRYDSEEGRLYVDYKSNVISVHSSMESYFSSFLIL